jgi:hypothetical protein
VNIEDNSSSRKSGAITSCCPIVVWMAECDLREFSALRRPRGYRPGIRFDVSLQPKQEITYELMVACLYHSASDGLPSYDTALHVAREELHISGNHSCSIHSCNHQFNNWMRRSVSDIQMMTVGNPEVGYPYAGVPWFSTVPELPVPIAQRL